MEKEERKTVPRPESGREEENELVNLRYEVASAKRQITSLQNMLSAKNREAAGLRDALIERDVLLKEAFPVRPDFWKSFFPAAAEAF